MLTLGPLAFLTPWMLGAVVLLPGIWWLVRLIPPAPRHLRFPALWLLRLSTTPEETPAHTPLWLLAMRLAIAVLLIGALAGPVWHPGAALPGTGPLVLVIDDGWSAAPGWPAVMRVLGGLLTRAEREGRGLVIATTAVPLVVAGPMPAVEARARLLGLEPKPWPTDRRATVAALQALALPGAHSGFWLTDGLADSGAAGLVDWFRHSGGRLEVLAPTQSPLLLMPPAADGPELAIPVARAPGAAERLVTVRLLAGDGRVLARDGVRLAAGAVAGRVVFDLPSELRNQAVRASLEGEAGAGATVLLDERWRRRPVGLVDGRGESAPQPLLSDLHYLEQALVPIAEVRRGSLKDLLGSQRAVLILADVGALGAEETALLAQWVTRGGLLLRFAGPRMAAVSDSLLPVRLRPGGRVLGGALTWEKPAGLAPFDAGSPFAGLAVPADVTVSRQVLAEPGPETAARTWARLADGTPLVSGERRGAGALVLVHTTAGPEWSNLALSGLYIDMLRRLVALSAGVAGDGGEGLLQPLETLDGLGRLGEPPATARALEGAGGGGGEAGGPKKADGVGPTHPPGFYGTSLARNALNLGASGLGLKPLQLPPGVAVAGYAGAEGETGLAAALLLAALVLALADMLVGLRLRGLAGVALAVMMAAGSAFAAPLDVPAEADVTAPPDVTAEAAMRTWLAYVQTGNAALDDTSRAGLEGLAQVLSRRTAVDVGGVTAVSVDQSDLAVFPLLYWRVPPRPAPLSGEAVRRVEDYLRQGGLIVFDGPDVTALRVVTDGLDLPPLSLVTADHVLTRAFYLLTDFPGRVGTGEVWVAAGRETLLDGVSSVVVGGNDWAGAWAIDDQGRPVNAMPGGERQREMAYRFGVNLVMYALTGNYKADQVHVPAILERLGR